MTKFSRPQERATRGKLQHSPTPTCQLPWPQACPPCAQVPRVIMEPRTRARHSSLPAEGGSSSGPLSSMSPAQQPQLVALTPPTTQENEGSPGPSLWPPTSAGAQLGLEGTSTPRPLALGHQMPALGWSWPPGCTFRWLEHLDRAPPHPGPLPGPAHRLCLLGEPLGDPLDGEPLGDPFPGEPLFSPLNMVVKAGAGSGWARRAAGSGRRGASLLEAWLGSGEVGLPDQQGRQFLEAPPCR